MTLTATGTGVYVSTMTTFLSKYYDAFEETLTHMKSIKLKSCPGDNVKDFRTMILVDAEYLESSRAFNSDNFGKTTCIFEDTSNSVLRLWEIKMYKDVTEFTKKLHMCDMNAITPEELITYESLVQKATHEYCDLIDLKWWETATGKENSQYKHLLPKA